MKDLIGIVLAGGKSRRMGTDKALLSYDGTHTQVERIERLVRSFCSDVEISRRGEQLDQWRAPTHMTLRADSYADMGPLGGILTALEAHPRHPILVVACDLPFLDFPTLQTLLQARRADHWATAFLGEDGRPEPLCAIYEPRALFEFRHYLKDSGRSSPRDALLRAGVSLISLTNPDALTNVNDPVAYQQALERINARRDESSPGQL